MTPGTIVLTISLVTTQLLYAVGHGVLQLCAQAGVAGPFPDKAGTAASLSGFAMTAAAFAIGLFLGHALDRSTLPVTPGCGAFSLVLATVAWTLVQRHGDPSGAWCAPVSPAAAR